MEQKQILDTIKNRISQGTLEEAYDQLVAFLDSSDDYAELAGIARVNQADLYQIKAQTLKGIISDEDARLANNQLADKALQLIRQVETGKLVLEKDLKPVSSKALRYYIIGAVVALTTASLIWLFWDYKKQQKACPEFSETAELKVMILPFKQTGAQSAGDPAFDIMDGLNDLIDETPGMRVRALADVNEQYDINRDYPNSAQAVDIARNCNVQMLVWGKIKKFGRRSQDYTLDVRYRLLDAGGVRYAGDTTINRLLAVTEEANWVSDVQAVSRQLYLVLANQLQVRIAGNILDKMSPVATAMVDSLPPVDTFTSFNRADQYIVRNELDSAILEFGNVLAYYPDNATALKKRGALYFRNQNYTAAARDFESIALTDVKTTKTLRDARIRAYLKSEQPEKAKKELESARSDKSLDESWMNTKTREVQDSTASLQSRRDAIESAVAKTSDPKVRIGAAKANLGLGEPDDALKHATEVLRRDPKNLQAVQIAVDAQLQKGDTAKAQSTIKAAERAGADVKKIYFTPIRKTPLPELRKQE